jgi:DNA modification methylase
MYYSLRDYGTGQWVGGEAECTHIARTARNDVDEATLARRAAQYGTGTQAGSKVAPIQHTGTCPRCGAVRIDQQIGMEQTHDCLAWARQEPPCAACWVCAMRVVFRDVWRVLVSTGVLFINVGDSYASGWPSHRRNLIGNGSLPNGKREARPSMLHGALKEKDLCGMPWRLALALQADGFVLRSDCIWEKPSCMPESVTDRFTRSHEYVFLFAKSPRYYFDATAVRESAADWGLRDRAFAKHNTEGFRANGQPPHHGLDNGNWATSGRNARTVWRIVSEPLTGFQHYAAFPTALVRRCLLAGCPPGGRVLDPFAGSGTTLLVARELGLHGIGLDLSYPYLRDIARERLGLAALTRWTEGAAPRAEAYTDLPLFALEVTP